MEKYLITSCSNADLDRYGCAVGYTEFLNKTGQPTDFYIPGTPQAEVLYLVDKFKIPDPSIPRPAVFKNVIIVDASDMKGMDEALSPENVIEVIDHRPVNEAYVFTKAKIQIESVGSATTLIVEKFIQKNVEMSEAAAVLLYGAILSNTLNFKAKVTTDRDRKAAEWIQERFYFPVTLAHDMFVAKSDLSGNKLRDAFLESLLKFQADSPTGVRTFAVQQLEMVGAHELVKNRKNEILGVLDIAKAKMELDFNFLSVVGLEEDCNIFVTDNSFSQKLLEDIFGINFVDNVAVRPGLIMRKEIMPLIKNKLANY